MFPALYCQIIIAMKAVFTYEISEHNGRNVILIHFPFNQRLIDEVKNNNVSREYYLTDIVNIAFEKKLNSSFIQTDFKDVIGGKGLAYV